MRKLKDIINTFFGRKTEIDETKVTKHGHRFLPLKRDVIKGVAISNIEKFITQPRADAIRDMLKPLELLHKRERAMVDNATGKIFIHSDFMRNGRQKAKVLGIIDPVIETQLFELIHAHLCFKKITLDANRNTP